MVRVIRLPRGSAVDEGPIGVIRCGPVSFGVVVQLAFEPVARRRPALMWAIPRAQLRLTAHASIIALTVVLFGWAALQLIAIHRGAELRGEVGYDFALYISIASALP